VLFVDVLFAAILPIVQLAYTALGCLAVNLNHFRLLRVVGRGAFGKVRIVERKDTGLSFALKYIRKDEGGTLPRSSVGVEVGERLTPAHQSYARKASAISYANGECSSM